MSQAVATPSEPVAATPCPRCQKPLVDPLRLGWCKACGYCRSLEEVKKPENVGTEATETAPKEPTATAVVLGSIRAWVVVLAFGIVLLAAGTFAINRFMTFKPLDRAVWATAQIGAGLALMFMGQLVALLRIAPEDPTLSFKDAIMPTRLFGLLLKRLPATCVPLYMIVWGLTISLAAVIFIGGLDHWMNYLPGRDGNQQRSTKRR